MNLELAAAKAAFAVELGDVEFLADLVGHLLGHKRGGSEDEVEFVDLFQLAFQGLEGVHREA